MARAQEGLGSAGLQAYFARVEAGPAWRWTGRVVQANGQTVESEGPLCSVGEACDVIDAGGARHPGEVIGFRGAHVLSMPLDATQGIQYGDGVQAQGTMPAIAVG